MSVACDLQFCLPKDDLDFVVNKVGDEWETLRNARVFFTGGTGFIGRWLLASMLKANEILDLNIVATVLTRDPDKFKRNSPELAASSSISLCAGDVRSFTFPGAGFSHVIHGATDTSQMAATRPLELLDVVVGGTRRVLEFACNCGARRVLFLSSGAIYGDQPGGIEKISEMHCGLLDPLAQKTTYAEAKRLAEHMCVLCSQKCAVECVVARGFAFVGPLMPMDTHFAICNFIRDACSRTEIRVKGDGQAMRSYLYAADLAAWLWVMLAKGKSCRAYNLGSDHGISIGQLAGMVGGLLTPEKKVVIADELASDNCRNRYVPDITRARTELGLDVWTPLADAILKTARFVN